MCSTVSFLPSPTCLWEELPIFIRKGLPYASVSAGLLCGLGASLPLMALVLALTRVRQRRCYIQAALWFLARQSWSVFRPDV